MARRYDRHELGKLERTPQGGIKVPATLERTGVQRYLQPDGSWRREYRPPSEIFSPAHLAALAGAPVTDLHPPAGAVRADNWRSITVGHAGDSPRQDGDHVLTVLYIQDAETIAKIEAGERNEVSLGYDVDLVDTPGRTDAGEEYDAIQTNIRPNHIALVPRGRAQTAVLRLDAAGDEIETAQTHARLETMAKLTIAGKEYDAGSPEAVKALADLEASAQAAAARADALDAEVKRHAVKALASLKATATKHGVAFRKDADATEVMIETVKKIAPGVSLEGESPEYVAGAFAVAISMALDVNEPEPAADDAAEPAPAGAAAEARADALDARRKVPAAPAVSMADAARTSMIKRLSSARKVG